MRIRFLDHDPRAGAVVEMDSSRGRELIESGNAEQVAEDTPATPARDKPAAKKAVKKKSGSKADVGK